MSEKQIISDCSVKVPWIIGCEPYLGEPRWPVVECTLDDIAVVCANFGGIDSVKPLPVQPHVHGFYYTDQVACIDGWKVYHPNYPRSDFNHRLRARYFKHQIHRLDEVQGCRWLAWTDSNLHFRDLNFLYFWVKTLEKLPPQNRIMAIPHPVRMTVEDEYAFIQGGIDSGIDYFKIRYGKEKMPEQMAWMRAQQWDTKTRVLNGTIWMMEQNPTLKSAWDAWWDQNLRFGLMDQLSLPPLLKHLGCEPTLFPINIWLNEYWTAFSHFANI